MLCTTFSAKSIAPSLPLANPSFIDIITSYSLHRCLTISISSSESVSNLFNATTGLKLYIIIFSMCLSKLARPFFTSSTLGIANSSLVAPPWYFKARIVTTITTALGINPNWWHLISKNFSAPRSEPNPASVTTTSLYVIAILVANMLLVPCAILANGPQWIIAGVPSVVCTKLGLIASFSKAAIAPWAFKSLAKMGLLSYVNPTKILAKRCFKSLMLSVIPSIAITSLAAVMSNEDSLGIPLEIPPNPITIFRNDLSFISITRCQKMLRGSNFKFRFLLCKLLSIKVDNRLLALSIAGISPVKSKLISSIGNTWLLPPPVAPPLMPKTGPNEGSLRATIDFLPILFSAIDRLIDVVVLPSPAGVGVIAVTNTNFDCLTLSLSISLNGILALYLP